MDQNKVNGAGGKLSSLFALHMVKAKRLKSCQLDPQWENFDRSSQLKPKDISSQTESIVKTTLYFAELCFQVRSLKDKLGNVVYA